MKKEKASVYELPSCGMFTCTRDVEPSFSREITIQNNIIDIFKSYGVDVSPADIYQGSWNTRYEFYVGRGTNMNKCKRLETELATHTAVSTLKVIAPVPGRQTIAIDLIKEKPDAPRIGDGLRAYFSSATEADLSLLLGVDVELNAVTVELPTHSNILLHGSTGTGKSICMQGMLLSLLLKHNPDDVSLLLAAKHATTFTHFRELPHLYHPIITSSGELQKSLKQLATEIERRLAIFHKYNVSTLAEYNAYMKKKEAEARKCNNVFQADNGRVGIGECIDMQYKRVCDLLAKVAGINESIEILPHIVLMIDDVESLMPVSDSYPFKLLEQVLRYGDTAGIYAVLSIQHLATLRSQPCTMGLMKNRLAFYTPKRTDALYFLGEYGAEKLPPYGACLYSETGKAIRAVDIYMVQAEDNVTMASHWSMYNNHIPERIMANENICPPLAQHNEEEEYLYLRCVELVTTERKASTSLLQRRLSIGYGRAAKMLDMMEERGIISPPQGAVRARAVLI